MKQQFRSKEGCCICATKSSTTRFQPSADFESNFLAVFGAKARQRTGQICNACVLCVKRGGGATGSGVGGASSSKQTTKMAPYAKVVDSRKGTGPKHMKQICKRNRRRELREAAAKAISANKQLAMGCDGVDSGGVNAGSSSSSASCGGAAGSGLAGIGSKASAITGSDCFPSGSGLSGNFAGSGAVSGVCSDGVGGDKSLSASGVASGSGAAITSTPSASAAEFRTPMPPASERRHYYKKRVIMQPIKTPDTRQEISDLFDIVIRSRKLNPSEGPLSVQQVHSAFLNTKRRRMLAASSGSETASVGSTEPPESFTSDSCSSDTPRSAGSSGQRL
ncbi:hypothetical protein BOX15_Mlig022462g2 [Macrostomum lignano]|nr:hypothetical protein BOX15_Mlig022462g2 [Macrostomum lignano]